MALTFCNGCRQPTRHEYVGEYEIECQVCNNLVWLKAPSGRCGPPTYHALHRTADRIEGALSELLPHTFRELVADGRRLVARFREVAEMELDDQWPQ